MNAGLRRPARGASAPARGLRSTLGWLCALMLAISVLPPAGTVAETAAETERAETGKKPDGDSIWPFSEAMAHHQPLHRVPGNQSEPLCGADALRADRYPAARAYARETGSYALLIWRGGRCELARYFPPQGPSLRPESASMHKSVLALLVAAAIADGHIGSADDGVGRYLDAWADDPRGDIRLRDVLTMASGLAPLSREGGRASPAWAFVEGSVNIRETILARPLRNPPGTYFHYEGLNTQLLLMVLEAATGRPYTDYLAERLWQPLGADDAYLWMYRESPPMPRAFTAMMATAEDWLRIGLLIKDRGLFQGRRVLPEALVDAMTAPSASNPNYGWQLWLGTEYEAERYYAGDRTGTAMLSAEPFAVDDMIYFDGIGGQRVYISRSRDLVIVRSGDMRLDWDDSHLPNVVIRAADAGEATAP